MVAPAPAPGEERSLALALVNTELAYRGEPIDLLADVEATAAWLMAHGLTAHAEMAQAEMAHAELAPAGMAPAGTPPAETAQGATASGRLGIGAGDVTALHALRAAIRAAFLARIAGTPLDEASLGVLNATSAGGPRAPQLTWEAGGPERAWATPRAGSGLEVAAATLAADAIEVVSGELGDSLRACEAHGCVRIFLQDHGRRRWCSRTCGDRVRVARHYEKTRLERE
jgi:predicted RNA-binding Zn ribbon-like protein